MKKICLMLLAVSLLLTACGGGGSTVLSGAPDFPVEAPYVGFAATNAELKAANFAQQPETFFDSYVSAYAHCGATVYYDTLTPAEQKIYRIFQYAMDNALPCIILDDRLTAGLTCDVEDILYFYSLDSGVVEQNLAIEMATFAYTDGDGNRIFSAQKLYISDFTAEKKQKKDAAITKARQILAELPQDATAMEKAGWIYDYLGRNTVYAAGSNAVADHLYDALCGGATNCDGFANAYSLMCNLSGLTCAEKIYVPEDGSVGHTWNIQCLDGVWYNTDATGSVEMAEGAPVPTRFCFSDRLREYTWSYSERLPACSQEGKPFDAELEAGQETAQLLAVLQAADAGYVRVLSPAELDSDILQEVANSLGCGIGTRYHVTATGLYIYTVEKNG